MVTQRKRTLVTAPKREILATAKLTSQGQITLPKVVRDRFGLKAGDEVEFIQDEHGIRLKRHLDPDRFRKWRGFLKDLKGVDIDKMIDEMRGR